MENETKEKINWKRLLITLGIVIVTTVVIGGVTWFFMDQQAKDEKTANDKQILELEKQISELKKIQDTTNNTIPIAQTKEEVIHQAQEYHPEGMCADVMTLAIHQTTGATHTFSSACLPPGWKAIPWK